MQTRLYICDCTVKFATDLVIITENVLRDVEVYEVINLARRGYILVELCKAFCQLCASVVHLTNYREGRTTCLWLGATASHQLQAVSVKRHAACSSKRLSVQVEVLVRSTQDYQFGLQVTCTCCPCSTAAGCDGIGITTSLRLRKIA